MSQEVIIIKDKTKPNAFMAIIRECVLVFVLWLMPYIIDVPEVVEPWLYFAFWFYRASAMV